MSLFKNGTSCSVFNISFASQNSLSKTFLHIRVQNLKQDFLRAAFRRCSGFMLKELT